MFYFVFTIFDPVSFRCKSIKARFYDSMVGIGLIKFYCQLLVNFSLSFYSAFSSNQKNSRSPYWPVRQDLALQVQAQRPL